jgi:predicted transcriptional regulator
MGAFMVRITDDKHERLKELAKARGMSLNKLMEELSTIALAEFDAETRFKAMAATGNPERGIAILDKLDSYFFDQKS